MEKFNVFDAQMESDPSDPEGYRAGANRFGPKIGAGRLGGEDVLGPGDITDSDSNKVAYWSDAAGPEDRFVRVRRGTNLDYYDGEL